MDNNQLTHEAMEKLAAPFPADCISHLPKGGVTLSYVGHANITARLNTVDPLWTWEPFATDERGLPAMELNAAGQPVGLWIRLTVLGKTIPAYGSCTANKMEPVKELIGDALRNGAMRFGVALYLWAKDGLEGDEAPSAPHPPPQRPQSPRPQNGHNAQTRTQAPQSGAQRPNNAPRVGDGGDPVAPINELCAYAGSLGIDNPHPQHIMNILHQEGSDIKAVNAKNLPIARTFLQQHVAAKQAVPTAPDFEDGDPFADGDEV